MAFYNNLCFTVFRYFGFLLDTKNKLSLNGLSVMFKMKGKHVSLRSLLRHNYYSEWYIHTHLGCYIQIHNSLHGLIISTWLVTYFSWLCHIAQWIMFVH